MVPRDLRAASARGVYVAAGQDPRQEVYDRTHNLRLVRIPLSMRSWGLCDVAGMRGYVHARRVQHRDPEEQKDVRSSAEQERAQGESAFAQVEGRRPWRHQRVESGDATEAEAISERTLIESVLRAAAVAACTRRRLGRYFTMHHTARTPSRQPIFFPSSYVRPA